MVKLTKSQLKALIIKEMRSVVGHMRDLEVPSDIDGEPTPDERNFGDYEDHEDHEELGYGNVGALEDNMEEFAAELSSAEIETLSKVRLANKFKNFAKDGGDEMFISSFTTKQINDAAGKVLAQLLTQK